MKSQFTNDQITEVMKSRSITRKSAMKFLAPARNSRAETIAQKMVSAMGKDNGTQFSVSPAQKQRLEAGVTKMIAAGCAFRNHEIETFAYGEDTDQKDLVRKYNGQEASDALTSVFEHEDDKPEVAPKASKPAPKLLTPEQRGKARAEGLRLFVLAGKPKKQDFVKVFGKKGPAWTWEARAKAVGLATAEECATRFQLLLKKA